MVFKSIITAVVEGEAGRVRRLIADALAKGYPAEEIIEKALLPALDLVGQQFRKSEVFIPEVLLASRAAKAGLYALRGQFRSPEHKRKEARVLIGTVAGDMHDIGKNLVSMYLSARGYEVINLGIDVPPEQFVWAVRQHKPDIVAMSALLTTTMPAMGETIEALKKAKLRERVLVLVGGGPVTETFAEEIGADGYAYDARGAAEWVSSIF
ncbi:MAG: cobalamin B12-binding domain-containing protein [Thermacetogeniaceae bacterium]